MDTSAMNTVPATPAASAQAEKRPRHKLKAANRNDVQVMVPKAVDIPLPKHPDQHIAVPASINGRDLSDGKP